MVVSKNCALKLVENGGRYEEPFEKEIPASSFHGAGFHSLHNIFIDKKDINPDYVRHCLEEYTGKDSVVLDPFCGYGTVCLETALAGRISYASDTNGLGVCFTAGKLFPAELPEVMLGLQVVNLMRPVNTKVFSSRFAPFFDLNTFREIVNLRNYLLKRNDNVSAFSSYLIASILHGPGAGYLSAGTSSQHAVSSEEQKSINQQRHQVADYRSAGPRIIKKCAAVLRDGTPSVLKRAVAEGLLKLADARNLSYIKSGTVDAVITAVPEVGAGSETDSQWLRRWFLGIDDRHAGIALDSAEEWRDYMNSALFEMARVTRVGSRACLFVAGAPSQGGLDYAEELQELTAEFLYKFWHVEGVVKFVNRSDDTLVRSAAGRFSKSAGVKNSIVVLQRR